MIQVVNNNIKSTDPNGKVYYTHLNWLQRFLPILEAEWREIEVDVKGVFDKLNKGKVKVKEFVKLKKYPDNYFDTVVEMMEAGDIIVIKNWKFEVVKFKRPLGT
jgi:hypothetical protein